MSQKNEDRTAIEAHWILLRGLARESRHWGDFPHVLQKTLSDSARGEARGEIRVDTIDLPGTGRYSEMRSPISIAEIAAFTREKYLEIRERQRQAGERPAVNTYLVAMSLGGMVAAYWFERWKEDFRAAVLINTSFKGFSPALKRLSPPALRHFYGIVRAEDAVEREAEILRMVSNRPEKLQRMAREWAELHLQRPVSIENFTRQLIAAARFSAKLETPNIPILVLNSLSDRMVDPSCSQTIAKRWDAQLERHPTAGHDLPLDDAPWVAKKIQAFYEIHRD